MLLRLVSRTTHFMSLMGHGNYLKSFQFDLKHLWIASSKNYVYSKCHTLERKKQLNLNHICSDVSADVWCVMMPTNLCEEGVTLSKTFLL